MPWSPTTPSGLVAWHDAAQITGQSDNTALAAWPEAAGHTVYNLQGDLTYRPTYYNTTPGNLINGNPAVWFNGAHDLYPGVTPSSQVQPFTLVVVGGLSGVSGAGLQMLLSSYLGSSSQVYAQSGSWRVWSGSVAVDGSQTAGVHILFAVFNGASSQFGVDAVASSLSNPGTGSFIYTNMGADTAGGSHGLTGFVCETALYSGVLSSTDQTNWLNYSTGKWGTAGGTAALPGTASLALGPLTLTATGTVSGGTVTGTASLALGPLALIAVGGLRLGATITLGPLIFTVIGAGIVAAPPYTRITVTDRLATAAATADRPSTSLTTADR